VLVISFLTLIRLAALSQQHGYEIIMYYYNLSHEDHTAYHTT